jgi:alpha-L-fucosidase
MRGLLSAAAALALAPAVFAVVLPTAPQLRWQRGEIMALIHFNMATFFRDGDPGCTAQNWNGCEPGGGCNSSDPASFAPSALDTDQWVDSMVALGVTEAVLTAKHGCGFYLWPSNVSLPDGRRYPYRVVESLYGDVLGRFVASTSARGIGHGFYYSLTNNFFLDVGGHVVQNKTLLPGQVYVTQAQFEVRSCCTIATCARSQHVARV